MHNNRPLNFGERKNLQITKKWLGDVNHIYKRLGKSHTKDQTTNQTKFKWKNTNLVRDETVATTQKMQQTRPECVSQKRSHRRRSHTHRHNTTWTLHTHGLFRATAKARGQEGHRIAAQADGSEPCQNRTADRGARSWTLQHKWVKAWYRISSVILITHRCRGNQRREVLLLLQGDRGGAVNTRCHYTNIEAKEAPPILKVTLMPNAISQLTL